MQDLVSKAKGIGEKQTSAPSWSGAFLDEIYQKVAVRYVLMAEEPLGAGTRRPPRSQLGVVRFLSMHATIFREAGCRKQKTKFGKIAAPQNLVLEARENSRSQNRRRARHE
jgi:hypothetical protein